MHTPAKKAPPEFMQRYNAIMDGEEILDTPQKLKDFWLFAVEQGQKHTDSQEQIMLLAEKANWASPVVNALIKGPDPDNTSTIWQVHQAIKGDWGNLESVVKRFNPQWYESLWNSILAKKSYIPVSRAPREFVQRYQSIMDGSEALDTAEKLKNFWLFAIEQGWKSYDMREHVALLTEAADWKSPILRQVMRKQWNERPTISIIHDDFRDFKSMKPSPFPDQQTDEEYLDEQWNKIEFDVNRVGIE